MKDSIKHLMSVPNFQPIKYSNSSSIADLTRNLINKDLYSQMINVTDSSLTPNFSMFNDIEMIYLFVHSEKDINEENNKINDTKREYIRDLLIFYKQLLEHSAEFEINTHEQTTYMVLKYLTERNLRKYQDWLVKAPLGKGGNPYSIATLQRKLSVIKGFLRYLFQCSYIHSPLAENIKSSNVRKHQRPDRDMSSSDVMEILLYYKTHPILYSLFLVLATTGLRIRELCTARICDISISQDEEYWLKVQGKGRKNREVLLHGIVMDAIRSFRLRRKQDLELDINDESPIFTTATGNAYSYKYLSNYLTKKVNQVPVIQEKYKKNPISPHFFRHFFAIESTELGVDLYRLSQTLGHESLSTTEIYLEKQLARKNNAAHAWKKSVILRNI